MKLETIGSNQTQVRLSDGTLILFSYSTPVAARVEGKYFRTSTKHSVTTSKHINRWLDGIKAETREQSFFDDLAAFTPR